MVLIINKKSYRKNAITEYWLSTEIIDCGKIVITKKLNNNYVRNDSSNIIDINPDGTKKIINKRISSYVPNKCS